MKRVDPKKVQAVLDASKSAAEDAGEAAEAAGTNTADDPSAAVAAVAAQPLAPACTIDDFTKVDLRVARVVAAEAALTPTSS